MERSVILTLGLISAALPVAVEAQIHKCISADVIAYRDTPCAEGQREMLLTNAKPTARAVEPTARAVESSPIPAVYVPPSGTPLPLPGTVISVGMSDLEVLNLRGWGRPRKITRSKANGVFREEWTYASPVEGQKQLLQFANARLTAILTESAESAPQQVIRLTQQ